MEESTFKVASDKDDSEAHLPKELGHSKDDSLTSIDIQEMERVRMSLQSMLKSSENFLRDDKLTPQASLRPDARQKGALDENSFTSIATSDLLNNYAYADKKQVGGVSDSTTMDENCDPVRRPRQKYDKSLLLENTLLNDSLEKERFKRKHCEQQIKGLQAKLLEAQQELAVSVSAERKKDVMINQLDKTLARVVEDWKKHEQGKVDALNKLEQQRQQDEQSQQQQQEMLAQFEKDLSQAVEALSKEQERAVNAEQEKDSQIAVVILERDELLQLLEEEREKNASLGKEVQDLERKANRVEDSRRLLEQEKVFWQQERSQLESKIDLITRAHTDDLENERKLVQHEKQVAEDSQRVLAAVQKEVQQLAVQLDTCNREKENLKTEITLLSAKFEAQKTRQDSEHRAELERKLGTNLQEAQNQMNKRENELRTAHKKQVEDITKKYKNDLEDQLRNFHQQLKERDRKLKEMNDEYDEKLSKSHSDLVMISSEREALKSEKHNMIVRLQKMMQSHCEEALSLLVANPGGTKTVDHHNDSAWVSRQTPAPVTSVSYVGEPRGLQHTMSSFFTSSNTGTHTDLFESSNTRAKSPLQGRLTQPWLHSQAFSRNDEVSDHVWVRLPPVPSNQPQAESMEYSVDRVRANASDQPYPQTYNDELRVISKPTNNPSNHLSSNEEYDSAEDHEDSYPHEGVEKKGSYSGLSRSTTNESLEQEDRGFGRPSQPLNLSTDVLKMLQQQQSRQTELNHYVRQLLKKSPSSTSGGELLDVDPTDIAPNSVSHGDGTEPVISPIKENGVNMKTEARTANPKISLDGNLSDSTVQEELNTKQMAFVKSAATPRKSFRSSKIPVAQTPPNRDIISGKEKLSEKTVLTPEQVGQLARLIQMYQNDNEDDDLPSPQKMFQYLRDVQIRSEIEHETGQADKRWKEKTSSSESFLEQAIALAEQTKKDKSKAKRKLEVNRQANKPKEAILLGNPGLTVDAVVGYDQKSNLLDVSRRPTRAAISSESDLTASRKPENKGGKNKKTFTTKPLKRSTGKSTKAWK